MNLTENETRFVLWAVISMIGLFCFIGALGVKALINMAKDLTEIKLAVNTVAMKHDETEKRVTRLENHVYE